MLPAVVNNSTELVKHSAAIHISNSLTLIQRKISNILLKNAFNFLLHENRHSISISEIYDQMGWKDSNNNNEIKTALKSLNTTQVEWNIIGKDSKNTWGVTTILADIQIREGICTYEYSTSMREMLSKPNIYARLNLLVQKNFKSKHALAIWEYLVEALCSFKQDKIITNYISLEDFKKLLGINHNKCYKEFKRINEKIISKAINEINRESDINVSLALKKQAQKVVALAFLVERKSSYNDFSTYNDNIYLSNHEQELYNLELKNILNTKYKISTKLCDEILNEFSEDNINKSLEYVDDQISKKSIDNIPAYTVKAIKEGWYINDIQSEKDRLIEERIIEDVTWKKIREIIKSKIGNEFFLSWFNDVDFKINNGIAYFKTQSSFKQKWLIDNYYELLNKICKEFNSEIKSVEIIY